jgi:hypothetical protein
MTCSLCPHPASEPFALCGISGHLCQTHAEALASTITRFVRDELRTQRRKSRELEAELVPRGLRKVRAA